jgi:hypothetical protein
MDGILQLRRGGTKRKAPSKSFREKKKAQFKQRKKDELEKIVSSKSADNTSGIAGITITGKDSENREVKDIIPSNIPDDLVKFINRNRRDDGSLNSAAQRIIDEYSTTAVNPYAERMQRFKESPGGIEAFKERFPNPLVKAARGIGDFFREGTVLGRILSSLKPSDKKKAEIILDESRRQPYEVPEGIMSYEDKILRDLRRRNAIPGINTNINQFADEGIMAGSEPFDQTLAAKKRFIEQYTGQKVGMLNTNEINRAYDNIMRSIQREASGNTEEQYQQAAYGDMSNFQPPSTEEQVVDEATGTGDPGDQLRFELGGGDLSGSTSETDYEAVMPDVSTYSIPDIFDYNRPDQLRRQIDINTENADLFTNNAFMGAPGFPAGGVEGNFPEQKNMGGYMGMSTFDKLKMIADGIADNR